MGWRFLFFLILLFFLKLRNIEIFREKKISI